MPKINFTPQKRIDYIRKELARRGEVEIDKLAKLLNVSEMTIRRDLAVLEERGEVVRTYGGAASAQRLTFEFTFKSQYQKNLQAKRAIAKKAIEFIENGQTIILDTGTTTLEIARALKGKRRITVITTSLAVVSELQFDQNIELILLGGYLRDGSPDLHGPITEQNLDMFRVDITFMGADAIGADGVLYTNDLRVRNLDIMMSKISEKVIPVVDSSKFNKNAMCKIISPKEYEMIITDSGLDKRIKRKFEKMSINIVIA